MTLKKDVPIFRVSSMLMIIMSIGSVCGAVSSYNEIITFLAAPSFTSKASVVQFQQLAITLGFGGPLFIGFGVCGLIGFTKRYEWEHAKLLITIGNITFLIQLITLLTLGVFLYMKMGEIRLIGMSVGTVGLITIFPFLLGMVLNVSFIKGAKEMDYSCFT